MDENEAAVDLPRPGHIFSDRLLTILAETPEYKLNLREMKERYGIHKDQLLTAYAMGEFNELRQIGEWLAHTFPEDCRTAIIWYGQKRLIEEIAQLNQNITELIAQLQLVTKHK